MPANFIQDLAFADVAIPLGIAAALLLGVVALWFSKKPGRPWKPILYAILIYGAVDFGVFRNPVFFGLCARKLNVQEVGFKQWDTLRAEVFKRQKPRQTKYLALGSSQVWSVFNDYANDHDDFEFLSIAGLGAPEYLTYKEIIERHCGDTILLYLSDTDLGRNYGAFSFKAHPPRDFGELAKISRMLCDRKAATASEIADLWIARALSPYRCQFIFRGILKKISREQKAFAESAVSPDDHAPAPDVEPEGLLEMTADWFEVNLAALEEFITWCDGIQRKVIVVQGHYHPNVLAEREVIHFAGMAALNTLCAKHENASFVRYDGLHTFTADEYTDATHVRLDAGKRFAEILMAEITSAESDTSD